MAAASLAGAAVLSVWGGPRQRVGAILSCLAVEGLLLVAGGSRPSLGLITLAAALFMFTVPIVFGCNEAIWQSKVAHEVQGRVFAARQVLALGTVPLANLISGPFADHLFNPLLMPGGRLAQSVGRLIGVGPGRGIGLLFMLLGAGMLVVVAGCSWNSRLRRVEQELPDAVAAPPAVAEAVPAVVAVVAHGAA
jgi:hypothetical protein